jgi:hypothetical protein
VVDVSGTEQAIVEQGPLATYLHGHIAGSRSAEALAQRLIDAGDVPDAEAFLSGFIDDIRRERSYVDSLLDRMSADQGILRRGVDAAAELASRAMGPASAASPGTFADLEALAIGVWGKRLLWGTLSRLADVDKRLGELPLDDLIADAERQEVELLRLRQEVIVPSLAPDAL